MNFEVITFGSATIDFFLVSKDFDFKLNFASDAKIETRQEKISSGGGGTNVAAGLARLGLKTAAAARLGQDQFAPLIVEDLRQEGVWTGLVKVIPGEKTDSSVILVNQKGEKLILVSRGLTRLEEQNLVWDKLSASWFHLSSLEGNLKLASKLINYAQSKKIKVSWNPGSRELDQKDNLLKLLSKVQILILNQKEAELLFSLKLNDSLFWKSVFKLPLPLLAITQSSRGCFLVFPKEGRKIHLQALKTKIVESTGAGDAFAAGLIAGLFYQETPKQAALWGLANGASVVSCFGAKTALLTRKGIKKWLQKL